MAEGGTPTEQPVATASPGDGFSPPEHGPRRRSWPMWAGLAVVLLAVLAAFIVTNLRVSRRPALSAKTATGIANQKVGSAISTLQSQPAVGVTVYNAVRAGLVVIESKHTGGSDTEDLGTGIIIDAQGQILTALHVVQGGSTIEVTFADGTSSLASITSSDPDHDIAVLTAEKLPSVIVPEALGDAPQVGDQTFAVGNPIGLVSSLSAGVISGLDRSFPLQNGRTLKGMIQFDAAVNPGNSGGPLLNAKGQVIGIVTGLANPDGATAFSGIGFAVPIATAGGAAGAPPR